MNVEPTSKYDKLPKWAQDEIKTAKLERDAAVDALNQFLDKQTPSPFRMETEVCTGEADGAPAHKTYYVQGHSLECECSGIRLNVIAREMVFGKQKGIKLQWEAIDGRVGKVAMIPTSFQTVELEIL